MNSKQLRTSALAVGAAVAIALSGTFAWQSLNQTARNETIQPTNPGGRLHDDFNGYGDGATKDIYVENFGTEPIYARVRLDEYMEIGDGAGLRSTDGTTPNPDNKAVSLVSGADIEDETTWTTHIPGSDTDPFHNYWTWTLGGQTVYMPTFNKNKDSLKADVNGTLAGTDPADDIFYDDYVAYKVNDTKIATEYADADADATDECGPDGGPGGTGVVDVNYTETADVTHTAKETLIGTVITMAQYTALSDAEKTALNAWVYDADGWAYWSQAIAPHTATGLLLDQISLTKELSDAWYYAINAVAQFVTADDLGRLNNTGFYDTASGSAPTGDALDLLDFIGVTISSVDGSVTITATADAGAVTAAVPGKTINLAAAVAVTGEASPVQDVTWTLTGNTSTSTTLVGTTLTVGADETAGGTLRIVASSNTYDGLKGRLSLPVEKLSYTMDIKNTEKISIKGTTVEIKQGGSATFSLDVTSTPDGYTPSGSWSWSSGNTSTATVTASGINNTTVAVAVPSGATVGNTTTITATNGSLSASFTVKVKDQWNTMTVAGIEWYVLVDNATITGTDGNPHNAALLLSKNVLEKRRFDDSSPMWSDSTCEMRTYLNGDFLTTYSEVSTKAVEVTVQTRIAYNDPTSDGGVSNKVFLLSEADVFGTSNQGKDTSPQSWEYTYNGAKLACFTDDNSRIGKFADGSDSIWWLRSPASYTGRVALVYTGGTVNYGDRASSYSVRPAFWYNLDA